MIHNDTGFLSKAALALFLLLCIFCRYVFATDEAVSFAAKSGQLIEDAACREEYRIQSRYTGRSDITIVAVQDLHGNFSAQKQHSRLLAALLAQQDQLNISFIGVEGSAGLIDTSYASAYPDAEIRETISNYLLKEGFINGIEWYSINENNTPVIYGIDDAAAYRQNADLFLKLTDHYSHELAFAQGTIRFFTQALQQHASLSFDEQEYRLFEVSYQLRTGEISMPDGLKELYAYSMVHGIDISDCASTKSLIQAFARKEAIDYPKLDSELSILLEQGRSALAQDAYDDLVQSYRHYAMGTVSSQSFFAKVYNVMQHNNVSLNGIIELKRMVAVIDDLQYIADSSLRVEAEMIIERLIAILSPPEHRVVFDLSKRLAIITKMLRLNASRDEFLQYSSEYAQYRGNYLLNKLIAVTGVAFDRMLSTEQCTTIDMTMNRAALFYEKALNRDRLLFENAVLMNEKLHGSTVVMLCGGFHADGIMQLCKKQDISCIVLRPVISNIDCSNTYQSHMLNIPTQFASALFGQPTHLMSSSQFDNLLYPENPSILRLKWVIMSAALNSFSWRLSAGTLQSMFEQQQREWFAALETFLTDHCKPLIKAGVIDRDDIVQRLADLKETLSWIELDYAKFLLYQHTLAIPVTVAGPIPQHLVLSITPEEHGDSQFPDFLRAVAEIPLSPHSLRIWTDETFSKYQAIRGLALEAPIEMPELSILPADLDDLDTWFTEDIERDFGVETFGRVIDYESIFFKAEDGAGNLLGLSCGQADPQANALFVHALEISRDARYQNVGKELIKQMVRASKELGFNGAIVLVPAFDSGLFYESLGFVPFPDVLPGKPQCIVLYPAAADKLMNAVDERRSQTLIQLTIQEKQHLMVLLDLFGLSVVEKLLSGLDLYNRKALLAENISYGVLHEMIRIAGMDRVKTLLMWDPKGLFNIAYSMLEAPDMIYSSEFREFIALLIEQRTLYLGEDGQLPQFVIEPASEHDIEEWFSYGIPRTFSKELWLEPDVNNKSFYKAVAPTGQIVGLVETNNNPDFDATEVYLIETCTQAKSKGMRFIGTGLVKAAVMQSIEDGNRGRLFAFAVQYFSFYESIGFEPNESTGIKNILLLNEQKAQELLDNAFVDLDAYVVDIKEDKIDEFVKLPIADAVQRIDAISDAIRLHHRLSNNDKLFIMSQFMLHYNVDSTQALSLLHKVYDS